MSGREPHWALILAEAGLPADFEPLEWQRKAVECYVLEEPFVFLGGRQHGKATALRLLLAAEAVHG